MLFSVAKQGKNNETRKKHAQTHRKIRRIYLGTMTRCGSFRIHSHSNKDGDESCKHRPTPLLSLSLLSPSRASNSQNSSPLFVSQWAIMTVWAQRNTNQPLFYWALTASKFGLHIVLKSPVLFVRIETI